MIEEKYNIDSYLRNSKDKYTYFLLAASASAIAFSITQTKTVSISWSQLPLGFAVICWGLSFYFGCKCATKFQELLQDSADLYESNGAMERMPETKEKVIEMIGDSYSENLVMAGNYSNRQFRLLISGAILFVAWHVIEMVIRATNVT